MSFREKFARFMQGRYGNDDYGRFLLLLTAVCLVLKLFLKRSVLTILVWALIIYYYIRFLSRDIRRRYDENTRFLELKGKVVRFFGDLFGKTRSTAGSGQSSASQSSYKIFSCPGCRQKVRVPKGRGRICITCPKCGREFIKRS